MKIKSKLRLGFGFLFLMVMSFGGLCGFYLNEIARDSEVILKNNYESLSFTREMRKVLDNNSLPLSAEAASQFHKELIKQESNTTEPGEHELTSKIRKNAEILKSDTSSSIIRSLRYDLSRIEEINMQAILRKNDQAQRSVKNATLYMQLVGTAIFLILLSFSVNFPSFIADPLLELTEGIKEISRKNYSTRLSFPASDEFSPLADAFNQMAGRLNDWEHSNVANIMSEKLRIETIIEQMKDAIIGLNENREILFINTAAEQLLKLEHRRVIGRNAHDLAKTNDLLHNILSIQPSEKPLKFDAEGKELYFQLESTEIVIPDYTPDEDNLIRSTAKKAGQVYILRNITKFQELDEAKTHFLATISHELKTPISSIKLSLKLLMDERVGRLNTEQADLLDHIKDDAQRLLKLTSELLDLAQVETGNIRLSFMDTDSNDIALYAINAVQSQAAQKHIQIEFEMGHELPAIFGDVEKTTWVLINFLSNAIRYSPDKSKVIVGVKQSESMIEFSVKDFGKGIEERYQTKVFDRYFQIPADGINKSGTGLGLAISKDFIDAQSGRIWVESNGGKGSRFCFVLPVSSNSLIKH
ncbi:ATP-binding protein [Daejeonella sp.]|uniref:ATP-binding protein n=1 Tax=Daejeonella sp. TaxID=2805397 RepID=UPI0030BAEF8B